MDEPDIIILSDVTFVIPVRIDSPERTRNLDVLIDFIMRSFDSNILIMEADSRQQYFVKEPDCRIQYFFEDDKRPVFHRTFYLNNLYRKVETPLIAVWDTDAIVTPEQIVDTVMQIRKGNAVMGIPYDGRMFKTTATLATHFQETQDFDLLIRNAGNLQLVYGDFSVGGAFIVDKEKYLQAGGENEFFTCWGAEDFEREKRMEILYSQPVYRAKDGLFHLWHPRYLNSNYANSEYEKKGKSELLKVCAMNENELKNYIKTWPWHVKKT